MILDLKPFVDETLDIKMADGAVLRIPKPSQKMVIKILNLDTIDENTPEEKALEALNALAGDILNSNIDAAVITADSVAQMGLESKIAIINAYTQFMRKLQADPITPSHPSPEKRKRRTAIRNFFRGFAK